MDQESGQAQVELSGQPPSTPRRGRWWRLTTPVVLVAAGALLVTSSINARGTDLRAGRYGSLADLAREQADQVTSLRQEVARLRADIDSLSAGVDSNAVDSLQRQVAALQAPAGLSAVRGPGLTVSLTDAPPEVQDSAGNQVANAIVHQQDIQAVVNALWSGGAEAMTLQGQRVVSTTGIKCVGNTVILHGVPYSPPYVISAIGDPRALQASLDASVYVQAYLEAVREWRVGWSVRIERTLTAPAYDGPVALQFASVLERS